MMEKIFLRCILFLAAVSLINCGGGSSSSSSTNSNNGSDNQTVISSNETLSTLTIADGETLVAPSGYSLTMTVDNVETSMDAGTYNGNIGLTVTDQIPVTYSSATGTVYWRAAAYIEDGLYISNKSVPSSVVNGTVGGSSAVFTSGSDATPNIKSVGENFNGIVVTGDSSYEIDNPYIRFTGNGGNDFSGYGASIVSKDTSDVTINNANIVNYGVVRTAVFAGGSSTITVNDSYIEVHNGTLPSDYVTNTNAGQMKEVPWQLGLSGNCRATNLVSTAKAYYNNSTIIAEGWGCLSTDDSKGVTLVATDCTIKTLTSGYGTYSIGDGTIVTFNGCTVDVADMAMILANGTAKGIFTKSTNNTCQITSKRFGVMVHASNEGSLTINEGTTFDTEEAVILVKTASPAIVVDNATLTSTNGIILQTMNNDDPNMSGGTPSGDLNAAFSNMTLAGDIYNGQKGNVNVSFKNASITGAISTTTTTAKGAISKANYKNVSEVTNTTGATGYGMTVLLDAESSWVVSKTSYLTGLTVKSGASITAQAGYDLTMTVNGITTTIAAGDYTGDIVLMVAAD
jgi:hypothetical protein